MAESVKGAKVLVTGATGFTGGALARRLLADGADVTVWVRSAERAAPLAAAGAAVRPVDICDGAAVRSAMAPYDIVFHIAAAFRAEHDSLEAFRRVNVGATRHLLEAAHRARVGRFVHCSTVGVQGEIDDPPADEDYRFRPGDFYQQSKMEGELAAREYFGSPLPVTVVRPVGIYGPGDTRFLKLFRPIRRGRFVMIGRGETLYHLTYIDDLVEGFLLAGRRPEAVGEVFTIGGPRYTTLNELVAAIARAVDGPPVRWRIPYAPVHAAASACAWICARIGVEPPLYPRRVEFFGKSRAFSIEKARRRLGYEPRVDLGEGLARTAAWYRKEGLL